LLRADGRYAALYRLHSLSRSAEPANQLQSVAR